MRHIYLNLKRFDVPTEFGGVNRNRPVREWGESIVSRTREYVNRYSPDAVDFVQFFPEAHLLPSIGALHEGDVLRIGCQSVHRTDVEPGGNFGALTTNRPAAIVKAMGCTDVLIGHCEERADKAGILAEAGVVSPEAVNRICNREARQAAKHGLRILYCIGEKSEEQENWRHVLGAQLRDGLESIDASLVTIAYEPVWSIGPGKQPADREYIRKIAGFIKEVTNGLDVVYGGGLKKENAAMLASIPEIDGGLIALTRFSGDIGFYPEEYGDIIETYLQS